MRTPRTLQLVLLIWSSVLAFSVSCSSDEIQSYRAAEKIAWGDPYETETFDALLERHTQAPEPREDATLTPAPYPTALFDASASSKQVASSLRAELWVRAHLDRQDPEELVDWLELDPSVAHAWLVRDRLGVRIGFVLAQGNHPPSEVILPHTPVTVEPDPSAPTLAELEVFAPDPGTTHSTRSSALVAARQQVDNQTSRRALIVSPYSRREPGFATEVTHVKTMLAQTPGFEPEHGGGIEIRDDFSMTPAQLFADWELFDVIHFAGHSHWRPDGSFVLSHVSPSNPAAIDRALEADPHRLEDILADRSKARDLAEQVCEGVESIIEQKRVRGAGCAITSIDLTLHGKPISVPWPAISVTDAYLASKFSRPLARRLVYLSSCSGTRAGRSLESILGPNTSLVGWNMTVDSQRAALVAPSFYDALSEGHHAVSAARMATHAFPGREKLVVVSPESPARIRQLPTLMSPALEPLNDEAGRELEGTRPQTIVVGSSGLMSRVELVTHVRGVDLSVDRLEAFSVGIFELGEDGEPEGRSLTPAGLTLADVLVSDEIQDGALVRTPLEFGRDLSQTNTVELAVIVGLAEGGISRVDTRVSLDTACCPSWEARAGGVSLGEVSAWGQLQEGQGLVVWLEGSDRGGQLQIFGMSEWGASGEYEGYMQVAGPHGELIAAAGVVRVQTSQLSNQGVVLTARFASAEVVAQPLQEPTHATASLFLVLDSLDPNPPSVAELPASCVPLES